VSIILGGSHSLDEFSPGQLQALAITLLKMRTLGFDIALFFSASIAQLSGTYFTDLPTSPEFWG